MNFFILASTLLLVFGGTLAASIAVANAAERTPRRTGLFLRFIATMIESRQLQALRVIDRYRAIGHRASASLQQSDSVREQTIDVNSHCEQLSGPSRSKEPRPFGAAPRIEIGASTDNSDCLVPIRRIW